MPDQQQIESALIVDLKPHPRNYRGHPEGQVAHLEQSLRDHGIYRNVVVANDNTILAGHGVIVAAQKLGADGGERGHGECRARAP